MREGSPLLQAIAHPGWGEPLHNQWLVLAAALLLGLLAGAVVERRFTASNWKGAFGAALHHGVGLPLVALLALQLTRHASRDLQRAELLKVMLPVLAVWLLARVAARAAHRVLADPHSARWLTWGVRICAGLGLLLYLTGALPEIIEALDAVSVHIGPQRLTAWTLLRGVVSVAVTLLLALWLSSLIEARLLASPLDINLRLVVSRLVRAAVFTVALLTALQMVGIDLTVVGVFGGALGVGLGLGLQRIAANYVSGFVILLERSVRVGDNVRLDTFQGRIQDIKTRYTVVRSAGGTESIVPNEMLISSRIENLSYTDPNVWFSTVVSVSYASDLEQVLALLARAAGTVQRVVAQPAPSAVLSNFGADGLEITVGFWIADPENGTLNVRGAVNLALWRALREAGVEIPFPQRVLHWPAGAPPAAAGAQPAPGA
ncbi:MAG: mechanosensitive ion channel [Betaproteobacteria bacterium]|nr:mechanosensitive ion channel [Betaproteobacteria bacterium]MBU6513819.1 mechanosensitive ion channel [Betaproteobacteria bacterium]MDE1955260.1 mechanosensitive ion channel [Betaproteobacteria bacterium]MDE2153215.1 mechanosensitive ion channel [Betaproteobacteria bacterium]